VAGRAAGGDDHRISHRRLAGERDVEDVLCLVLVELRFDELCQFERIEAGFLAGGFRLGGGFAGLLSP